MENKYKNVNKEVAEYIGKQKSPQREICHILRNIILETFPDIKEELKMGVPWYEEGKYYIGSLKDHVNLSFSIKGLSDKEKELFEGGGKLMRHIKIYSLEDLGEKNIVQLLKLVKDK